MSSILASCRLRSAARLIELEKQIYNAAGQTFNINSPKQLGEVLFGKLQLPVSASHKTSTGALSTDADVLDELRDKHEIVPLLLEHRELSKLNGTYVEALPELAQQSHRAAAHRFQPDRRSDRAHVVVQSQSAKYPDQDRDGPARAQGVYPAHGLALDQRGLFAGGAAHAGASGR